MESSDIAALLQEALTDENLCKLMALDSPAVNSFVADAIQLCRPDSVFICTDSAEDVACIRHMAVEAGEEQSLNVEGHTIHFDGPRDQARDKANTRYLVHEGMELGASLNTVAHAEGTAEVRGFLKDAMRGKRMIVRFFCLGPTASEFSLPAMQITDSSYVGHSEDILYRVGYEQFRSMASDAGFFRFLHSAGQLDGGVSADVEKRRVYIDLEDEIVYSTNTQYAGNTVGFKKLALRLAIRRADREGWLAEHMFVMGAHGPGGRVTYFAGAFPSACGKTSTAMINGETIIGDDLAYLRKGADGVVRAANVESGIFGIIRDVSPESDPVIWNALTTPGEVIFSNVLVTDGKPWWLGDGRERPTTGVNFQGQWEKGKKDADGKEIPCAHMNSRYTIRISALTNRDPLADDPNGVPVGGIIYGGRDSDTWPPVRQSFDWAHGVLTMGAVLESETTSATLGAEGVRAFQPMSNMDFISLPLGKYLKNHLDFAAADGGLPLIFASNYFIRSEAGDYLTGMNAKNVWIKWMELRVHGEVDGIETPIGLLPRYADLKALFRQVLDQDYAESDYEEQFAIRVPENLGKLARIEDIYRTKVDDAPESLFEALAAERSRLQAAQAKHGDRISPNSF
jgi:phosphoenolpyruvate carboxykinase (GTP)